MKITFGDIIRKLTSRKFIAALIGTIFGIAVSFGADASEIQQIAGMVTSLVSIVSYIIGEATVDAASAGATIQIVEDEPEEDEEEAEE